MPDRKRRIAYLFWLMTGLVSGLFAGCQKPDLDTRIRSLLSNTVPVITCETLAEKMSSSHPPLLLDVRENNEYQVSHIPGAIWINPSDPHPENTLKTIARDREVVVYCSVGYRSEKAGEKLLHAGFTNVKNLWGGIFLWNNQGRKMLDSGERETSRIHAYNNSWGQYLTRGEKILDE